MKMLYSFMAGNGISLISDAEKAANDKPSGMLGVAFSAQTTLSDASNTAAGIKNRW